MTFVQMHPQSHENDSAPEINHVATFHSGIYGNWFKCNAALIQSFMESNMSGWWWINKCIINDVHAVYRIYAGFTSK